MITVEPTPTLSHPQKTALKKVVVLGSGGLRIGQAGEFDYSGSQAIKALKEEGIRTVLINPNIATVQTDSTMADELYLQPLNLDTVTRILDKEQPDALLLNVGGQTALNLGLELEREEIFSRYKIAALGTPIPMIRTTEDREAFKQALAQIQIPTARSRTVSSVEEALDTAKEIGYPLMIRTGFSLGGLGSGVVTSEHRLKQHVSEILTVCPHVLIEESLLGWKEIEYELLRDCDDNSITVCNMENFDPMGIHTGESIVVAPSQTLNNEEYHRLRSAAIKTASHLGIIGECNIQYALHPQTGEYRLIEVNARLSRSSALASKATGYPLAFISTKLCLGYRLWELKNRVTKKTSAFFEPALDYLVVKMPRWDIQKMRNVDRKIGSEMKSVGEVMAIGCSFPEALQKAVRMCAPESLGLGDTQRSIEDPESEIRVATDRRLQAIYHHFRTGGTVKNVADWSSIDPWFLNHIKKIATFEQSLKEAVLDHEMLLKAKQLGFSDAAIARITGSDYDTIRKTRQTMQVVPYVRQIDTLAGEYAAETNYLFLTYHAKQHDLDPSSLPATIVLGSGPYAIGSSVEFDWCAVNTARTLRKHDRKTILINSNPETVSTDYDESDRLYFEELSLERIQDIADFENYREIVLFSGGQIANNLAMPLYQRGYSLLGTCATDIDRAENRKTFSSLLNSLEIDQPAWEEVCSLEQAQRFAQKIGYPLLVRPSYVLSGSAMHVVHDQTELNHSLKEAAYISPDHPIVISQFICNAKELEIDGVADRGHVVIYAISEHIENAGVHSGDATIVLPPQRVYLETIHRTKQITRQIVKALNITGPFNIQFIAIDNAIKVIECNVRASRSFPFVSKVTRHNFITICTEVLLGIHTPRHYQTLELDYVGVKTPLFSFNRLKGANPVPHVEMASTGEVACIGDNYLEAFYRSWLATEQQIKGKRILLSLSRGSRSKLTPLLRKLEELGWKLFATEGTHDFLTQQGIKAAFCYKASAECEPSADTLICSHAVDLVINLPVGTGKQTTTDGYKIRRLTIDNHIPLITNLQQTQLFLMCLTELKQKELPIKSWQAYTHNNHSQTQGKIT